MPTAISLVKASRETKAIRDARAWRHRSSLNGEMDHVKLSITTQNYLYGEYLSSRCVGLL